MDQKASLLEQLRIERPPPTSDGHGGSRGHRAGLIIGICAVVLIAAGGVTYWKVSQADAIPVRVAVARAVGAGGTAADEGPSLLDASGYVVAMREATVSSQLIDRVDDVLIQAGERVTKGQVVARLDDAMYRASLQQAEAQVGQASASLAAARLAAADAKPIYLRDKKELAEGLISPDTYDAEKQTYDAAQAAVKVAQESVAAAQAAVVVNQRNLAYTIIRAPFDGVVTAKNAQPGQIVSPQFVGGGGIADIVDMGSLEVDVDVSENFISRVHPHQPATITLNAYPDWHIPAEVIAIIPTADKSKATVSVRVGFKLKDPRILPQMGARVSFLAETPAGGASSAGAPSGGATATAGAVVVPATAVQTNGDTGSGTVFVVDGHAVQGHSVRLGARTSAGQLILSGLDPGASVAIGDLDKLHDGARVRITQ